jgi:AcrR family transcriptional regulator
LARKKDTGLREKILQASLEMTVDPDFVNFTTSKIAKAAGVSEGTLYNYFENKGHLFQSLFEYSFDQYFEELKEYISTENDIREKLKRILKYHISYFAETNKVFRLIFLAGDNATSPFKVITKIMPLYTEFISEMLNNHKDELNKNINTDFTASFILGSVQVLVLSEIVYPGKMDLNKAIEHLYRMLSQYLFKVKK